MLHHLRVRNLGVLGDAAIDPGPGFTVVTGETGTGKTLLLGSLRLLVGEKANSAAVGPFADSAQVDGLMVENDQEIGVSRFVPKTGRSRGYLEGTVVSADTLSDRVGRLVEIVGQHDQLNLKRSGAVLEMLDASLPEEGQSALSEYLRSWRKLKELAEEQARFGGDSMTLERELDLVRHQVDEIEKAQLATGDDDRLESMALRLRNAGLIREQLSSSLLNVDQVAELTGEVVAGLRKVAEVDSSVADHVASSEALAESWTDLARSIRLASETNLDDPGALEEVEARLTEVGDLKRKYGRTVEDILVFLGDSQHTASTLAEKLKRSASIGAEVEAALIDVDRAGQTLSEARHRRAEVAQREVGRHLSDLGLERSRFEFEFTRIEASRSGIDQLALLFASDSRLETGPVVEVASGGELSRLILAIRLALASATTSTLVFDEIDTGVGGQTALELGKKLARLAMHSQVLCVTHLPQVAAHANTHYLVRREGGAAEVVRLDGKGRVNELTRMLAGLPDSEVGQEAAAELLDIASV